MSSNYSTLIKFVGSVASTVVVSLSAWAAPAAPNAPAATKPTADSTAQAAYKKQVDNCNNGTSNQDRATCLKEAGAALAAARNGTLDEPDKNLKQDATARCDAFTGDDRKACVARVKGKGVTEGSVESGGILREVQTSQPASAAR